MERRLRLARGAALVALFAAAGLAAGAAPPEGPPRVNVEGVARLPVFSHAAIAGDLVFVAGMLGTRDGSLELVPGGAGPETAAALRNVERILAGVGATLDDVVKCTVFLGDMDDYAEMNAAYAPFFGDAPPARSAVAVAGIGLGGAVEIECIAYRPESARRSERAPPAASAVGERAGGMLAGTPVRGGPRP